MNKFKLYYHIENGGDGSAHVVWHRTKEGAIKADDELDEGWGEPCWGCLELETDGDFLNYSDFDERYQKVMYDVLEAM